ncbi:hypothetical protein [Nocardia suismassiliense]|uniref:hypothetical protein n=1 Tax=Nocardia suismassiliense TaxID=2077092 RepID=UPI001F3539D2|nr:hypothetical protein [Nocardia suismassiliense]
MWRRRAGSGGPAVEAVGKTASDRVQKKLIKVYRATEQFARVGRVAELRGQMKPLLLATG